MGRLYRAICKCGYHSEELLEGIGFNREPYNLAYCDHCKEVSSENFEKEQPLCSRCNGELKLYNTSSFINDDRDIPVSKRWHCPRCKQKQLKFETAGLWD